jgi:hypothetical protein
VQLVIRVPDVVIQAIDLHVKKLGLKSRNQIIYEALVEWIVRQELPEVPLHSWSDARDWADQAMKRASGVRDLLRAASDDPMDEEDRKVLIDTMLRVPEDNREQRNKLGFIMEIQKRLWSQAPQPQLLETQVAQIHFALQMQIDELKKEIKTLKGGQPDSQENTQAKKK